MAPVSAQALEVAAEIVGEIGAMIVQAFAEDDPANLEKVTDVLPASHPLRLRAKLAHEEEVTRRALENQE